MHGAATAPPSFPRPPPPTCAKPQCFLKEAAHHTALSLGISRHNHGQGYNFALFDGSARWYGDPTNHLEQFTMLQTSNNPVTGVSRWHWQNTGANDLSRYIQMEFIGWDRERFLKNTVTSWR